MIRIRRPPAPPAILSSDGVEKTAGLCESYRSGHSEFSFSRDTYAHASVKDALVVAQHMKCCFCEGKVGHDGDVEHFRPKAAVRQSSDDPLEKPGYYWLAYAWSNLLLACSACNSRHKRNLFPLADPAKRARHHDADFAHEMPLFIDPAAEDPEEFIEWRSEVPVPRGGNARGGETIHKLSLDRRALRDRRREQLVNVATLIRLRRTAARKGDAAWVLRLDRGLAWQQGTTSEFSAAKRAFIRKYGVS